MSKHQPLRMLLPCAFAVLLAALSITSRSQQPQTAKSAATDTTSCLYDFERGVIPDCIHKAANGGLFVKQQVLKQLRFDSHGLAVLRSAANGWMYVSRTGKVVISGVTTLDNGADTFHDGLVRVVRNGKYGFSNRKGQLVVSPVYDGAMNFESGKAKVCNGCTSKCVELECENHVFSGGEWFEIDTKGTMAAEPCKVIHGRTHFYGGDGQLRIWQIGTHHEYEPDEPSWSRVIKWLEAGVQESERANYASPASSVNLYADFLICPTEPLKQGSVQRANIKSASHRRYVRIEAGSER